MMIPGTSCTLIVNPTSGSFSEELLRQVVRILREGGLVPQVEISTCAADVPAMAARACAAEGRPLVVAMGGDGTFAGMLNGLVPGRATVGFIPSGTANVLSHELGIRSPLEGAERIVRGETRPLTVGGVEHGTLFTRFFLMAGIGFDGAVVRGVRLREKKLLKQGAYLLSALRQLLSWDASTLVVEAEGKRLACHGVIACNASRYGGNFTLDPESSLFSPGLRLVCLPSASRFSYLRLASRIFSGAGLGPGVTVIDTAHAVVSGTKPVQADGDYLCQSPVTLRATPEFANLVI